ncbi:MAG TPA: ABC-type transport auxiliary lipoprotein family protein [Steroidobacteraceae bacterium]|nr:ABC-type transport auxiliary lipoprotein family protein [Steroidobacteraceae bacterium]
MNMRTLPIAAAAAGAALALAAGCAGFHSNEAVTQTYVLRESARHAGAAAPADAAVATAAAGAAPTATLQVLRPLAAPGLDTDQIALLRDTQRLDYFSASRWPAPLPDLLQTLAIDALRAAGHYRAVQPDATAFVADQVLQIEIRHCEVEYSPEGSPVVHVQLLATLGQRADRTLVASVVAGSSKPAAANRMQAVVAAFQEAVGDALDQLASRLGP